jgi:hypothetical protein
MNLCLCHLAGKWRVGFAVPPPGFKHHLRISAFEYSREENMEISEREDTQCNWNEFVYPFTYILFPALRFNICWVVSGDDVIVCDSHRHVAVKL